MTRLLLPWLRHLPHLLRASAAETPIAVGPSSGAGVVAYLSRDPALAQCPVSEVRLRKSMPVPVEEIIMSLSSRHPQHEFELSIGKEQGKLRV